MKCECCGAGCYISVGQFYKNIDGSINLLCSITYNTVCMICIMGNDVGNRWKNPVKVKNMMNISLSEFKNICGNMDEDFRLLRDYEVNC